MATRQGSRELPNLSMEKLERVETKREEHSRGNTGRTHRIHNGGARGQGRSHAVALAKEGAGVVAVDICQPFENVEYPPATTDDLAETADAVERVGGKCVSLLADIGDIDQLAEAYTEGTTALGPIDIVVANAGIFTMSTIAEMEPALWQQIVST